MSSTMIQPPTEAERIRAQKMVKKAISNLITAHIFFGCGILELDIKEDTEGKLLIPSCGTNGKELLWNATFINSMSLIQTVGVLAHETGHCILLHPFRRGLRDKMLWNVAGDHVINLWLDEMGFTFPDGLLMDSRFKDMSTEEVYNILASESKKNEQSGGGQNQMPQWGLVDDYPKDKPEKKAKGGKDEKSLMGKPETKEEAQAKWSTLGQQAKNLARAAGKEKGESAKRLSDLYDSSAPWEEIFAQFMEKVKDEDSNWCIPNRRFVCHDIILPTLQCERLGHLVFVLDVSGSVYHYAKRFLSEANFVVASKQLNAEVTVLQVDTVVQKVDTYAPGDEFMPEVAGGGGTSFAPAFEWVEENLFEDPACLVYLTDGQVWSHSDWGIEPNYPVLWIGTRRFDPPFGEFAEMDWEE